MEYRSDAVIGVNFIHSLSSTQNTRTFIVQCRPGCMGFLHIDIGNKRTRQREPNELWALAAVPLGLQMTCSCADTKKCSVCKLRPRSKPSLWEGQRVSDARFSNVRPIEYSLARKRRVFAIRYGSRRRRPEFFWKPSDMSPNGCSSHDLMSRTTAAKTAQGKVSCTTARPSALSKHFAL